jgi:uncharacterized membrane protein HdeD (DUF308 family)
MTTLPFQPDLRSLRAFTLAEGILMLVLGVLALVFPVVASFGATVLLAFAAGSPRESAVSSPCRPKGG